MPYADPDIYRAYQKEYRQKNRERLAAYNKQWRTENADHVVADRKRYRRENSEAIAERAAKFYREHTLEKCMYDTVYKARKKVERWAA